MKKKRGEIIWITGWHASGKTTIAKELKAILLQTGQKTILLDGDDLRKVYTDFDYSLNGRKRVAWRNARLAILLSKQDFQVICATISLFKQVLQHCEKHSNLKVFLIEADVDVRQRRSNLTLNHKFDWAENQTKYLPTNCITFDNSLEGEYYNISKRIADYLIKSTYDFGQ